MLAPVAVVVALTLGVADRPPPEGWRRVTIPVRGIGLDYRHLTPQVIDSREKLDALLTAAGENKKEWSDFAEFEDGLAAAKVDFETEVLVLLPHGEGSGSIRVRLSLAEEPNGVLRAVVVRTLPRMCTWDMAYYCFAVVVKRERVKRIVYRTVEDDPTASVDDRLRAGMHRFR